MAKISKAPNCLPASGHSDGAAQIIRSHAHARGYVSRSQVPGHRVAHAGQQGRHLTGKSGAGSGIIQQTALPQKENTAHAVQAKDFVG